MSLQSRGVPTIEDRLSTIKYQHAVAFTGQKLLHLIMRTLIQGDINNIIGCIRDTLRTNTQFKNSFTKEEQHILATVPHEKWDISLIFKVIQKVCGLEKPSEKSCWTNHVEGEDECLEFLITKVKDERNKMVHNFELVMTKTELEESLNELTNLAMKVISTLAERAPLLGKQLSEQESNNTIQLVFDIIENTKGPINEGPPTAIPPPPAVPEACDDKRNVENAFASDSLQSDGVYFGSSFASAGAGGQAFQGGGTTAFQGVGRQLSQKTPLEYEIEKLTREIWEYAGPRDDVV